MPVTYDIDKSVQLVTARYAGEVTLDEISAMFGRYIADPDFCIDRPHLADLSAVTGTDIGFAETYALFSMFLRHYTLSGNHLRIAVHAPDAVSFGIARIFQNLAESSDSIEVDLFDRLDKARDWALHAADVPVAKSQG